MKLTWKNCFKIVASVFVLYLAMTYWDTAAGFLLLVLEAAAPLLLGCAIAYVVNILMSSYERHWFPKTNRGALIKSRRGVCILGAYLTLLAIVALIVRLVVPQLVDCVQLILAELPGFLTKLVALADELELLPEDVTQMLSSIDWKSRINELISFLASRLGGAVDVLFGAVASVASGIVTAFVSVIFSVYLLLGKKRLARQMGALATHYLKPTLRKKLSYVLSVVDDCFHKYIVGQCIEALILGSLCTLGMLLLRLPYATMIGALIAFTALIPVAGAYIGAFVGAFMILTVSPVQALIFLVFLVVLQQLEGNIVYPRVVGFSVGLPGIWVLAAVTVGGGVAGILGMLLGVPLAAAAYRLLQNDINRRNSR